jgi:hypothetical protein
MLSLAMPNLEKKTAENFVNHIQFCFMVEKNIASQSRFYTIMSMDLIPSKKMSSEKR